MSEAATSFYEFSEWEREFYRQAFIVLIERCANGYYASEQAQQAVMASRGVTVSRAARLEALVDEDE